MVSFENFVKSMPPRLLKLQVKPTFCFTFEIPDDVTATKLHTMEMYLFSYFILFSYFTYLLEQVFLVVLHVADFVVLRRVHLKILT